VKLMDVVIGLGVSGRAAARFLLEQGASVMGVDKSSEKLGGEEEVQELVARGLLLGKDDAWKQQWRRVILSPGVPLTHPLVWEAKSRGVEVIGEAELGLRALENRCVGITGTNGKTTTVMLVTHLLRAAGKKARSVGNIGLGLTDYARSPDPEEILVIELSSFQLESLVSKKLEAAAILNITPNHLNWHPDMESYAKAKARIFSCLKPEGKLFVSHQVATDFGSLLGEHTLFDQQIIEPNSDLRYTLPGRRNVSAAFALCLHLGLSLEDCDRGLGSFEKPPHRVEWVEKKEGVTYYNDSKASNVDAVLHALGLFDGPLILLAGGVHKGASYAPWIAPMRNKVKQLIVFGEASDQMQADLSQDLPILPVANLEEAVEAAKNRAIEGDTVLLSPGCSSYDQFKSYEHRGEEFKRIVRKL
jgi:UDP-N-acetylmuramoylalanine--D-glutamate ligase